MSAQQSLVPDAVERDPLDFNRTPAWVVQLLLPFLGSPRTVLDVGCGDGAIGKVLRQAWPHHTETWIHGVEADPTRARAASWDGVDAKQKTYNMVAGCSILDTRHKLHTFEPDLVISNPPFGLEALSFLRKALEVVTPGGLVAFLLPTHWDHDPDVDSGFARQRFLDSLRLPDGREGYGKIAIVGGGPNPCRPSFKKGKTATDRYAWFMFGEGWAGRHVRAHAIPLPEPSPQLELVPAAKTDATLEDRLRPCPEATWNPLTLEWEAP